MSLPDLLGRATKSTTSISGLNNDIIPRDWECNYSHYSSLLIRRTSGTLSAFHRLDLTDLTSQVNGEMSHSSAESIAYNNRPIYNGDFLR